MRLVAGDVRRVAAAAGFPDETVEKSLPTPNDSPRPPDIAPRSKAIDTPILY